MRSGQYLRVLLAVLIGLITFASMPGLIFAQGQAEKAGLYVYKTILLTKGRADDAILKTVSEQVTIPPGWHARIDIVDGPAARVKVEPLPFAEGIAEPTYVYLSAQGTQWEVLAQKEALPAEEGIPLLTSLGVPEHLVFANAHEQALYVTAQTHLEAQTPLRDVATPLIRREGAYAVLRIIPSDPVLSPTYLYAKSNGTEQWQVLAYGATFERSFYQQHTIPPVLVMSSTKGRADDAILKTVSEQVTIPPGWHARIDIVDGPAARVKVEPLPFAEGIAEPTYVYLSAQGTQWEVLAQKEALPAEEGIPLLTSLGVPEHLVFANAHEQALYVTAQTHLEAQTPLRDVATPLIRREGAYAVLRIIPSDPVLSPTYLYAKSNGTEQWQVLAYGATFERSFYQQHTIPSVLWIP